MALVVVCDHKRGKAARNINGGWRNRVGGSNALFQFGHQVVGECDLRIVGAQAQNLLRNDVEGHGQHRGQTGEDKCIKDQGRTAKRVTQHGEMLLCER
jgi:hypothetical protein